MPAFAPGLLTALALSVLLRTDAPAEIPKAPVIRVLLPVRPPTDRALKYALLPEPLDLTPGNAAPLWMRASLSASRVNVKYTDKEDKAFGVPLAELPRDQVRRFLDHYGLALRLADQAARCQRCDWERRPLTFNSLDLLPLEEISSYRQLLNLLSLRCRLELAEGRRDAAVETLRTGFVLGQHVAQGNTMIEQLVALALSAVMLGRVEEMLSVPDMPNFYWPLTTLPHPLLDTRLCLEYERDTLRRTFPQLRRLEKEVLTEAQARQMLEDLFQTLGGDNNKTGPAWETRATFALLAASIYPDARQTLLAHGRTPVEVENMPAFQVVLLHLLYEYDFFWDETLKWMSVPYAEAREPLEKLRRQHLLGGRYGANILLRLLMPAVLKTREATVRLDRQVATLRCVEAIRLYAATHGGKPPTTLGDVVEVPLPTDPVTGKGFEAFYKAEGGLAVLEVPPLPGQPLHLGKRYEFVPMK
jgi:hypothetical protein